MATKPLPDFQSTAPDNYAVADQAVVVAQAGLWLAQVEAACIRSGCDPAYCRVRDSLGRSLDAEREELVQLLHQLQSTGGTMPTVVATGVPCGDHLGALAVDQVDSQRDHHRHRGGDGPVALLDLTSTDYPAAAA